MIVSYIPKQNVVLEKDNQIIIEVVRSLIYYTHLDPMFWIEALNNIGYTLNQICSCLLPNAIIFKAFIDKSNHVLPICNHFVAKLILIFLISFVRNSIQRAKLDYFLDIPMRLRASTFGTYIIKQLSSVEMYCVMRLIMLKKHHLLLLIFQQ